MLYVEYHELERKYKQALKTYDDILTEQERLFNMTQPQAVTYEKDIVTGGEYISPYDSYIIKKEALGLDNLLKEAEQLIENRARLLGIKEKELRYSQEWTDIIYAYKYIDQYNVKQILLRTPLSRSHVYRVLTEIKENLGQNEKIDVV